MRASSALAFRSRCRRFTRLIVPDVVVEATIPGD